MLPFCNNETSQFGGATCLVSHVFVRWVHHSFQTSAVNVDREKQFCVPCASGFTGYVEFVAVELL